MRVSFAPTGLKKGAQSRHGYTIFHLGKLWPRLGRWLRWGERSSLRNLLLEPSRNRGLGRSSTRPISRKTTSAWLTAFRVLSSYQTDAGERLWIITEADRSVTTLLLPEEALRGCYESALFSDFAPRRLLRRDGRLYRG